MKQDHRSAKLVRRPGEVVVSFAGGRVIERLTLDGDKLLVERFDPGNQYPKTPTNKGVGELER